MSDKRGEGGVCPNDAVDAVAGATACADVDAATGATVRYEHGVDADGLRVQKRSDVGGAAAEDANAEGAASEPAGGKPADSCPSAEDMERFVDAVTTASWKAPSEEAEAAYRESLDALRTSLPPIMPPGASIR